MRQNHTKTDKSKAPPNSSKMPVMTEKCSIQLKTVIRSATKRAPVKDAPFGFMNAGISASELCPELAGKFLYDAVDILSDVIV